MSSSAGRAAEIVHNETRPSLLVLSAEHAAQVLVARVGGVPQHAQHVHALLRGRGAETNRERVKQMNKKISLQ